MPHYLHPPPPPPPPPTHTHTHTSRLVARVVARHDIPVVQLHWQELNITVLRGLYLSSRLQVSEPYLSKYFVVLAGRHIVERE